MSFHFKLADYHNPTDAKYVIELLNAYATDPMGGGEPLADEVKNTLIEKLQQQPTAFSILGYEEGSDEPIALANCFTGFSTFKAKPLVNIHDCYVAPQCRGQYVGQQLLDAVRDEAIKRGSCKITLEVLEGNERAKAAYQKYGFKGYALDEKSGSAVFWEYSL
ncbi:GNAT family N-acetyltransferase [Alteromonas facilis]|uniref:GNAT family N-acetyltransferase n=1 Tax=Alteromonas facilis TaxID=2048004 RepID=UPI000C28731D|nr:GNAT family N-acetyltransferase [Alteromonas facilis]